MTALLAFTQAERDVLEAFALGDTVVQIAEDRAMRVSAVRGLLYRMCDFDRRRAQVLLESAAEPEPVPEPVPEPEPEPEPRPDPVLRSVDITARAGRLLTFRQLDHWCRSGYLRPLGGATPGAGTSREFTPDEAHIAILMARLVAAGVSLPAAHHAARNGLRLFDQGLRIVLDERPALDAEVAAIVADTVRDWQQRRDQARQRPGPQGA